MKAMIVSVANIEKMDSDEAKKLAILPKKDFPKENTPGFVVTASNGKVTWMSDKDIGLVFPVSERTNMVHMASSKEFAKKNFEAIPKGAIVEMPGDTFHILAVTRIFNAFLENLKSPVKKNVVSVAKPTKATACKCNDKTVAKKPPCGTKKCSCKPAPKKKPELGVSEKITKKPKPSFSCKVG